LTNSYYTGTDYSTMHPFHFDFWWHLFIPWSWHNWIWIACMLIILAVRFNDMLVLHKQQSEEWL